MKERKGGGKTKKKKGEEVHYSLFYGRTLARGFGKKEKEKERKKGEGHA